MKKLQDNYVHLTLLEVAEKLHIDYYSIINGMVHAAGEKLTELKRIDVHHFTTRYINTCETVLSNIQQYLHERKSVLMPYLKTLHQKDITGHNCSTCSGACDMGHLSHFASLRDSHIKLGEELYQLQLSALPLYSNLNYPAVYSTLRCEMQLLDSLLRELIYLEEAFLMPGIIKSQKKINAHA